MKKFALLLALAFAMPAFGQSTFLKYGPAAGIQKNTGATYQDTAAISSDISLLFCTSSTTNFLRADGTCAVPSGVTPTGTTNLVYATPNGSTGAATLRALVGADLPPINLGSTANGGVSSSSILLGTNGGTSNGFFSITGPATSLKTFTFPNASANVLTDSAVITVPQGGTGRVTLPVHGVLLGEATAAVGNVAAMAVDTLLQGQGATADPAAVSVPNCASPSALTYSSSSHIFLCSTITGFGTPTALVGPTAITGSSPNSMASDSAPALNQTANYTMTGQWNFTGAGTAPKFNNGFGGSASVAGPLTGQIQNTNGGTSAYTSYVVANDSGVISEFGIQGTALASPHFSLGPTGTASFIGPNASIPFCIATAGTCRILIGNSGAISGFSQTTGTLTDMAPDSATSVATVTGCTTAPTPTVRLAKSGSIVTLSIDPFTCTSNTNALSLTSAIPLIFQPARSQTPMVVLQDNSLNVFGVALVSATPATTLTFFAGASGNFTTSGAKGSGGNAITFSYQLK
jgi:hypothetical protein